MVRNYKSRADNSGSYAKHDVEKIKKALDKLAIEGNSLRSVAEEFDIKCTTLRYYNDKYKNKDENNEASVYDHGNQVFPDKLEKELVSYLLEAYDYYAGLDAKSTHQLAYELAVANQPKVKIPKSWIAEKQAGRDWLFTFMSRHPTVSFRKPEATGLSRVSNFNERNVELFFNNFGKILSKYKFKPKDIYNVDESGITTAHIPNKIVGCKGQKQIGAVTSLERGTYILFYLFIF